MKSLNIFKQNFYAGLKAFFQELNVPLDYLTAESTHPQDILKESYTPRNDAFSMMEDVYFLGVVNDAIFNGNKTFTTTADVKQKVQRDYDGLFIFGVTLKSRPNGLLPTRSQLAEMTRAFNREFKYTPVVVVLKYDNYLAFANSERLAYKQEWREGEKVGKVIIIKDINIDHPHRAHIDILADLRINQSDARHQCHTFLEMHQAWQKTLDTSELNKKFYREIANWYFWAIKQVEFPADDEKKKEVRDAKNVIRLITRLIFVWFLKEKNLVPEKLFMQSETDNILNKIDKTGSTYYKAILQNLFLATLNTEMNKDKPGSRKFVERSDYKNHSPQHLMPAFRYERFFKNSAQAQQLFENIPFLNGGLFENLDYEKIENDERQIIRIDCFSDNPKNEMLLKIPDELFFGKEKQVDLSDDYGDTKRRKETVRGIIHTLNKFKFTIEENTPIEEEVALDPELLGKVFENLLASYNPETHTTARKQTGSFYTPREIVNFMVDESLIAYLENSLTTFYESQKTFGAITPPSQADMFGKTQPLQMKLDEKKVTLTDEQKTEINKKLHQLISYNEQPYPFNDQEVDVLIKAIDNVKILDPACGSGAFPMGILQKLVYVLSKLDPHNKKWKDEQIAKVRRLIDSAGEIAHHDRRQEIIADLEKQIASIEDAFTNNELDYGRKLYLIENCIYGVDIQEIAVQIAKLRFFISLVIDQRVDPARKNLNIRPLPNLETKFVAANTLIGLDKPKQTKLRNLEIEQLEKELKAVRQRHFNARTRSQKQRYRNKDEQLRHQIAELMIDDDWDDKVAHQIADWDPYDQNASSDFFDPEWMFGVDKGFDVVIGNPPYIDIKGLPKDDVKLYFKLFNTTENRINLYSIFIEKGISLLNQNGVLVFINPNSILINESYKKIRKYIVNGIERIIKLPDSVFEAATVETIVLIARRISYNEKILGVYFANNDKINFANLNFNLFSRDEWIKDDASRFNIFGNDKGTDLLKKIYNKGIPLENFVFTSLGITPYDKYKGHSEKLISNREFHSPTKISKQYVPLISGKNIHPFYISDGAEEYLKYGEWLGAPRDKKFFENPKIIVRQIVSGNELKIVAGFSDMPHYFTQIGFSLISKTDDIDTLKYILALLNSSLINFYHRNKFLDTEKVVFQKILIANCKQLPIKEITDKQPYITIVNQILSAKKTNPKADTSALEKQIDEMVYKLYGLTYAEVKIVDPQFIMSEAEYNNLHFDFEKEIVA